MKYKYLLYLLIFLLCNAHAAVEGWQISGRVGIITPEDSQSVSYRWIQDGNRFFIQFIAPLGSGSLVLTGYPGGVKLKNQKGEIFTGKNAEAILRTQLGWRIPVSNLYYWIQGEPAPYTNAQAQYDAEHRLIGLKQQGWNIQYLAYASLQNQSLPTRIYLSQKNIKVKILINKWHIKN